MLQETINNSEKLIVLPREDGRCHLFSCKKSFFMIDGSIIKLKYLFRLCSINKQNQKCDINSLTIAEIWATI